MKHQAFAAAKLSEIDSGEMKGRQFHQPYWSRLILRRRAGERR